MLARLYVCLVLITTIAANDSTTSKYESSKHVVYNQESINKLQAESLNESAGGAAESMKITENAVLFVPTNGTGIVDTKRPPVGGVLDKNGTVYMKPDIEKEGMNAESSQVISYPPYGNYEVTENVIDIPDDRTPAGPIVTNYTGIPPPLNLGKPNNKTEKDNITETNIKKKKNRITILHINAEYDEKENEVHEHKVVGIFKGIKNYIKNFHRGVVNGFHSFFRKHDDVHEHGERFERAADKEVNHGENDGVQNVDKTEYLVHKRHISMT